MEIPEAQKQSLIGEVKNKDNPSHSHPSLTGWSLESWMADPCNSGWPDTVLNIPTIGHRLWMDSSCIDGYLINYWFDNQHNAQVIYIPTKYLASLRGNGLEPDEVQSLLEFIGTSDAFSQSLDRPYALVIHYNNHYFNAIFDYKHKCVNVYGRYITIQGPIQGWMDYNPENAKEPWTNGDIWGGLTIYRNLKVALFGTHPEEEVVCNAVNWIQVYINITWSSLFNC